MQHELQVEGGRHEPGNPAAPGTSQFRRAIPCPERRRALRGDRPRDAPGGPRPDDPGHRAARRRRRSRSPHGRLLGRHRVRRRRGGLDPDVGEDRRPLRPQAAPRGRAVRLRRHLGAVRRGAGRHAAHRPARRPGCRRRWPHDAGDGRRRRPRRPARARALPGLHRGDVRRRDHRRAAHRRRPRRPRELALGLPRQPATRCRRPRRPAPAPARTGGRGRQPTARRVGRRAPGRRHGRPPADLHLGRVDATPGTRPSSSA